MLQDIDLSNRQSVAGRSLPFSGGIPMELYNLSEIRPLLERHGFHFSKSKGQNFLIREWVPKKIAAASCADDSCGVLEIGPGIGVLTRELSYTAKKVCCVELDRSLLPILAETMSDLDNVRVINADIMKLDIASIVDSEFSGLVPTVCANLPYQITTPVLRTLLELERFERITVMIQKEVAQRICAAPGTPEYGAFSLLCAFYAKPRICFDVTPDCFYPQPKVTSTVITMEKREPPADLRDKDLLFSITRAAFSQRRKTLCNALTPLFAGKLTKDQLMRVIQSAGFDERIRGEVLGLDDYVNLSNLIGALL